MKAIYLVTIFFIAVQAAFGSFIPSFGMKKLQQAPPPPTPDMRCVEQARKVHEANPGCASGMDRVNLTCSTTQTDFQSCVDDPNAQEPLALYMSCTMSQTFIDTLNTNQIPLTGYQKAAGQLSVMERKTIPKIDALGGKPIVDGLDVMPQVVDYSFPQLFDGAGNKLSSSGGGYGQGYGQAPKSAKSSRMLLESEDVMSRDLLQASKVTEAPTQDTLNIVVPPAPYPSMYCQAFGRMYFNAWYAEKKEYVYNVAVGNGYFLQSDSPQVRDFQAQSGPPKEDTSNPGSEDSSYDQGRNGTPTTGAAPTESTSANTAPSESAQNTPTSTESAPAPSKATSLNQQWTFKLVGSSLGALALFYLLF